MKPYLLDQIVNTSHSESNFINKSRCSFGFLKLRYSFWKICQHGCHCIVQNQRLEICIKERKYLLRKFLVGRKMKEISGVCVCLFLCASPQTVKLWMALLCYFHCQQVVCWIFTFKTTWNKKYHCRVLKNRHSLTRQNSTFAWPVLCQNTFVSLDNHRSFGSSECELSSHILSIKIWHTSCSVLSTSLIFPPIHNVCSIFVSDCWTIALVLIQCAEVL